MKFYHRQKHHWLAGVAGGALWPALVAGILVLGMLANPVQAQQAPTSYVLTTVDADQSSQDAVPGFGNEYASDNTYNLQFGQSDPDDSECKGRNLMIESFDLGGKTYEPLESPTSTGKPYENVIVNRVNNASVDYEKVTAMFSRTQDPAPTANGSTLYYCASYADSMESIMNSYIANRGADNLFANANSLTLNNIERVDFILSSGGVFTTIPAEAGFLLMERGGNDDFIVAAITGLNPDGTVASLGPLARGEAGDSWGDTGTEIFSTVFMSVESGDQPLLRPSQNIDSQALSGSFISFYDLGIAAEEVIYGFALFPGDVDEDMDLIDLTDVPLDTDGSNFSTGGLDLLAGGGFFSTEEAKPTLALISSVWASIVDDEPVISWTVEMEMGTMGYYLERWTDGGWVRVNEHLIPAKFFEPAPKTYSQSDPGAPLGITQRYQIVELDDQGRLLTYGPYDLDLDGGEISYDTWAAGIDWGGADSSRDADPDGDGLTNFQEYLAGTNPLDADSVLSLTSIRPVSEGIRLTWSSEPDRVYAVAISTSPNGPFLPVASGIEATPPENSAVLPLDTASTPAAFFRIIVSQP